MPIKRTAAERAKTPPQWAGPAGTVRFPCRQSPDRPSPIPPAILRRRPRQQATAREDAATVVVGVQDPTVAVVVLDADGEPDAAD